MDAAFIRSDVGDPAHTPDGSFLLSYVTRKKPDLLAVLYTPSQDTAFWSLTVGATAAFTLPLDPRMFQRAVDRVLYLYDLLQYKRDVRTRSILVKTRDGYRMLQLSDILFIERRERKKYIVCADGCEVTVSNYSMDDLDALLRNSHFYRCYSSFIINLERVERININNDKTIYPVSSRDERDFHNLMRVYLDAVFHPLLLENPAIFAQEGWHYELDGDRVTCKGVVFNEMKGVFSAPDALLEYEADRRLFPDTCYRWVLGGDPAHIPEFSWEGFAAAHRQWYNAANALIVLDGALDLDAVLAILGAVAENDPLLCPRDKGKTADARYWKGLSDEALARTRQEILHTTTDDVAGYARRMEELTGSSALCVLGPRRQLEACGAELDTIISL